MSSRNFGFGRKMSYAGTRVIDQRYGDGHFRTKKLHKSRWGEFANYCDKNYQLSDMRFVTQETVRNYHNHLFLNNRAVTSRQCIISSINVVMSHASRGRWPRISPAEVAGPRSQVRVVVPASLDPSRVDAVVDLLAMRSPRISALYLMAYYFGLRRREAILANLIRLRAEAETYRLINILDGTKGGRTAPRWVHVTDEGMFALRYAFWQRPKNSSNLLSADENLKKFINGKVNYGYKLLSRCGIHGYHDARAAYACRRYREITGYDAPVVMGGRVADSAADSQARGEISRELGHGRRSVLASYVGTARPLRVREAA